MIGISIKKRIYHTHWFISFNLCYRFLSTATMDPNPFIAEDTKLSKIEELFDVCVMSSDVFPPSLRHVIDPDFKVGKHNDMVDNIITLPTDDNRSHSFHLIKKQINAIGGVSDRLITLGEILECMADDTVFFEDEEMRGIYKWMIKHCSSSRPTVAVLPNRDSYVRAFKRPIIDTELYKRSLQADGCFDFVPVSDLSEDGETLFFDVNRESLSDNMVRFDHGHTPSSVRTTQTIVFPTLESIVKTIEENNPFRRIRYSHF